MVLRKRTRREGIILVVVVSMLALFAVIGLGYVIYAESAATASRYTRESQVVRDERAVIDPEIVLNQALGALIYDRSDDQTGVYSAIRGHSLARSMYGWNDAVANAVFNCNQVPFNGIGRLRYTDIFANLSSDQILNFTYFPTDQVVRHPEKYPTDPTQAGNYDRPGTAVTRYFGGYNVPYTYPDLNNVYLAAVRASDGQVLMPSFHRPWLFTQGGLANQPVDYNFLANQFHPDWYRPSGRLKLLRPRPVDQLTQADVVAAGVPYPIPETLSNGQINQLRNRIVQLQNAGRLLAYPSDSGGDVKNLPGSPGGNDSVWLDLGMPVRTTRSGKKYKPLVAFLVRDLDGLINVNVAGNLTGSVIQSTSPYNVLQHQYHLSNQGLGRHEINIERLLPPTLQTEVRNLFAGNAPVKATGRYANGAALAAPTYPTTSNILPSILNPPLTANNLSVYPPAPRVGNEAIFASDYYRVDVDAARVIVTPSGYGYIRSTPITVDVTGTPIDPNKPLQLSAFPDYVSAPPVPNPLTSTGSGFENDAGNAYTISATITLSERQNHPLLFNPVRATGNSRLLDGLEMHRLHGRYSSPLDWQESVLAKIMPQSMNRPDFRHSITLFSADLARPGLVPQTFRVDAATPPSVYQYDPTALMPLAPVGEQFYTLASMPASPSASQTTEDDFLGNPIYAFAGVASAANSPAGNKLPVPSAAAPLYMHDGRGYAAGIRERLDLNRPLRQYPAVVPSSGMTGKVMNPADPNLQLAEQDRRSLANDVFDVLVKSVGMTKPTPTMNNSSPEFLTLKYLAQLAVNIVDDIDEDDVSTVFPWADPATLGAEAIVFGTEMPKLVINEAYCEQTNGPQGDASYVRPQNPPSQLTPIALKYQVNTFVELHHTMVPPYVNGGADTARYQDFINRHRVWLNSGSASVYRIAVARSGSVTNFDENLNGATGLDGQPLQWVTFANDPMGMKDNVMPVDTSTASGACSYRCAAGIKNAGFFVVGPDQTGNLVDPAWKYTEATVQDQRMRVDIQASVPTIPTPTIVLQRLANPYLQHQPNLNQPAYNPYITVDVMDMPQQINGQPTVGAAIKYNATGNAPAPGQLATVMRRQPLAGIQDRLVRSSAADPTGTGPQNSFFVHNLTNTASPPTALPEPGPTGLERFDWYVHHDRKLISPIELTHVAAVAPHLVTQRFIHTVGANTIRQGHTAPWFDDRDTINPATGLPGPKVHVQALTANPPMPPNPPTASVRLYRALELIRVGDRTIEMAYGGRELGKVNINTIWDKAVFDAVCDAVTTPNVYSSASNFTQADVDSAWAMLTTNLNMTARTPYLNIPVASTPGGAPVVQPYSVPGVPYFQITELDLPFWGMGAPHAQLSGQYSPVAPLDRPIGNPSAPGNAFASPAVSYVVNEGIDATLFRGIQPSNTASPAVPNPKRSRIFEAESQFDFTASNPTPAVRSPVLERSLLSKVFEHFTTRSNVFAVYMTVGYFEVIDDSVRPERLGDEMGVLRDANGLIAENKAMRHRMFAIVDRTQLAFQSGSYDYSNANNCLILGDDQRKQGVAPFYYTSQIQQWPSAPYAGAWFVILPCSQVTGNLGGGYFREATGTYQGVPWRLQAVSNATTNASLLYLGSGKDQQRLAVRAFARIPAQPDFVAVILGNPPQRQPLNPASWPALGNPPDAQARITNAIAGNPGPQPDFDFKQPNYRGVVIYAAVLD